MTTTKVHCAQDICKAGFDWYIAVDWSMKTMAIARMSKQEKSPRVMERPTDILELQQYLRRLHGRIILTVEEGTSAQWLFMKLRDLVDTLIICDPYRNHLLSDGPKTDKIDAAKLCLLLRAGMLRGVFHGCQEIYRLRLLLSNYRDTVQAGVRALNQWSALERATQEDLEKTADHLLQFSVRHLHREIEAYHQAKKSYESLFLRLCRKDRLLRALKTVDGIGEVGAISIRAIVIDPRRFAYAGKYLSYCGLVTLPKESGQRSYGRRKPRYCRTLKAVYKTAAITVLRGHGPLREYYEALLSRGVAEHNARHTVARTIARVTFGILKTGQPWEPNRWRQPTPQTV